MIRPKAGVYALVYSEKCNNCDYYKVFFHDTHDYVTTIAGENTCNNTNKNVEFKLAQECSNPYCNAKRDITVAKAANTKTGHDWVDAETVVPTTCGEYTVKQICNDCGTIRYEKRSAPHVLDVYKSAATTVPTCIETQKEYYVCKLCLTTVEVDTKILDADNHGANKIDKVLINETCLSYAHYANFCQGCRKQVGDDIAADEFAGTKLTHNYGPKVPATCEEDAYATCTHDAFDKVVLENGKLKATYKPCNDIKTDANTALGHWTGADAYTGIKILQVNRSSNIPSISLPLCSAVGGMAYWLHRCNKYVINPQRGRQSFGCSCIDPAKH